MYHDDSISTFHCIMASIKPRLVFRSPCNERIRYKKKEPKEEVSLDENRMGLRTVNVSEELSFKVVFLGDALVGKTCLVHMIVHETVLSSQTKFTIGFDILEKKLQVNGIPMALVLWDTAGMEQFRTPLVNQYYRHVDGVILVYDVTRHETFENLEKWLSEVRLYCRDDEKKKILLIGNQCDKDEEKVVTSEEGKLFAETNGMLFVELSAKQDSSVQLLGKQVELLAEQMFLKREQDSMTHTMSNVIRLSKTDISSDWVLVDTPLGPIPSSSYASQDSRRRRLGQITSRVGQCQC